MFNSQRKKVIKAVKAKGVPAIYQWREQVVSGGLMSYGPTITSAYEQAGTYATQILDGETPQTMPVVLPETYELVINVTTARKAGFKIPIPMLTRAVLLQRKRKH
jgi:putative ABC transport system substrate-binding protein